MSDPILAKISELPELLSTAAADQLVILDASETNELYKTKRVRMELLKITNSDQVGNGVITLLKMAANSIDSPQIIAGAVDAAHLSDQTIARNLIYIQLFGVTELVVTTTAKAYFWVPSHLSGKKVKKVGMGLVTAGSSNTTVQLGTSGAYGSISGNGFAESADLDVSLPEVGTKIPINVTAGGGSPKGLDFWFVVG